MHICNAPFCNNSRNYNHAWCGAHRWERDKYKIKLYKELLPLWSVKRCHIHGLLRIDQCSKTYKSFICKLCNQEYQKNYATPERQKGYNIKYDSKRKNWRLKKRYGISLEEFNSILLAQNNCCAICKTPNGEFAKIIGKERNLAVDHCHDSKKVRGILCFKCNVAIGYLNHSLPLLHQAIEYLRPHS